MKVFACLATALLLVGMASAQTTSTTQTGTGSQTGTSATTNTAPYMLPWNAVSVGVGFLGTTGDPGFSGVNVFGGFRHRGIELAGEFDAGGTNIRVPDIVIKVRQQDYLFGPRFYFSRALSNPRFVPFAHVLFGLSHQSSDVGGTAALGESSDNSYAWDFGGGFEYHVNSKWGVRARGDVFRTHFLDDSQTHARYGVGVVYILGE